MASHKRIQIIDLFAGPGGLGEGFSNCKKNSPFKIAMSVEKERNAHKTLTLRAFYRALKNKDKEFYFNYIRSKNSFEKGQNWNFLLNKCGYAWEKAFAETMEGPCALGNEKIYEMLREGKIPTPSERKQKTKDQKKIINRIEEIKRDCKENSWPLVVIGGPPCQAYSKIGRARLKGNKNYNQENDQRFFLYDEYAEVIRQAEPDVFIMENVNGIGSAKLLDGSFIFPRIIEKLQYLDGKPGVSDKKYHLYSLVKNTSEFVGDKAAPDEKDFVVRAVEYGVPQTRERVILLGVSVRHDPEGNLVSKMSSDKLENPPGLEVLLSGLPKLRSFVSSRNNKEVDSRELWQDLFKTNLDKIYGIVSGKSAIEKGVNESLRWYERAEKLKIAKNLYSEEDIRGGLVDIDSIPLPIDKRKKIEEKREYIKEKIAFNYPRMAEIISTMRSKSSRLSDGSNLFLGAKKVFSEKFKTSHPDLFSWLARDFGGVVNHKAKKHMPMDFQRYLFNQLWTATEQGNPKRRVGTSPSPDTPYIPLDLASEHRSWYSHNFKDRFRTQCGKEPAKTITSHMHKDGHANIHFDPQQTRSLTVREAARIQTFPDDYFFEGGQSAQYLQVGNAVPPYLAKKIALHVLEILNNRIN